MVILNYDDNDYFHNDFDFDNQNLLNISHSIFMNLNLKKFLTIVCDFIKGIIIRTIINISLFRFKFIFFI